MKLTRGFIAGVMNKDLDERLLPPGQYRDALNVGVSTSAESDVGSIQNQLGNTNLSNLGLDASAVTIGAVANDSETFIYWFVTSDTFDYVFAYNEDLGTTITLLQDTAGRVLKFDAEYLITGVNIINDLLFWTDNLNPPRRLNVTRNYTTDGFVEDDISVIVKPPLFAPIIEMTNSVPVGGAGNITGQENNLEETFVEFSYRYKYENNEYSAMAPFSSAAFNASAYRYNYNDWYLESMVNANNQALITFKVGGDQVKEIQLLFRESQSTNIYIIDSYKYYAPFNWAFNDNAQADVAFTTNQVINPAFSGGGVPDSYEVGDIVFIKQDPGYTHAAYQGAQTIVEIIDRYTIVIDVAFAGATPVEPGEAFLETKTKAFLNNKIYTVLPSDELGRLFDNVPLKALAQELIGSRLIYGNYVQFFDLVNEINETIELDYDLYLESSPVDALPQRSFRSDRDYEIGIAYLDEYGRMTTVLTSNENTIYISPNNSNTANDIQVYINNPAPAFASHYRLFIKQAKGDYYTILPSYFIADGITRWFQIGPGDINKVKKGEYLICKHTSNGSTFSNRQYKVLDIESKAKDFLDIPNTSQPAGVYFSINDEQNVFNNANQWSYSASNVNSGWINDSNITKSQIDNPIFYGLSTTANSLQLVAVPGYTWTTPHYSPSSSPYRIKVTITDGANNIFEYKFIDQSGAYTDPLLVDPSYVPGSLVMSNNPASPNIIYFVYLTAGTGAPIYYPVAAVLFSDLPSSYSTGDYFIINVHKMEAKTNLSGQSMFSQQASIPGNGFANSGYPKDRIIEAGAQLTFQIKHYDPSPNSTPVNDPTQTFISSRQYLNLEEWFWEDQIFSSFKNYNPIPAGGPDTGGWGITFSRAWAIQPDPSGLNSFSPIQTNGSAPFSGYANWGELLTHEGSIRMAIYSPTGNTLWGIEVNFTITQAPEVSIFETLPADNPPEIYYETNKTFSITNGVHSGNIQNQTLGQAPAKVSLNPGALLNATDEDKENSNFNSWVFSNSLEAYRIKSAWNGYPLNYSPRASTVIEDYEEQRAEEALTYSGVYRENTGINNLNEFNLSIANFRYLDRFFGSIQKLHARDTDLIVLQEDKITKVLYGKNLLSDAVGGGDIVSIPEVLGTQIPYEGEFGISQNPESFDYWGVDMYCTDEKRGVVLSINSQGIYPISSQGMVDYFKDMFLANPNTRKLGAVDPFKQFYSPRTNPFDLSWKENSVCVSIASDSIWSITVLDTGFGTGWVTINNTAGPSYNGQNNQQVCFQFEPNTSGVTRTVRITFTACGDSYAYTVNQSVWRPIEVDSWIIGEAPVRPLTPVCVNDDESVVDIEYDYTSNPGGPIEFPTNKMKPKPVSFINKYKGIGGQGSVPTPGDTVTLKAYTTQTPTVRGFNPNFGNALRYLVTTEPYTEEQIEDLLANSTAAPLVAGAGFYEGSFVYNVPNDEVYLHLIWDFRNLQDAGNNFISPAGTEGTTTHTINFDDTVGVSRFDYNANAVANRFKVNYGNTQVFDSGFVVGVGSFNVRKTIKNIESACLIVETSGVDDGWDVLPNPTNLTPFLTNNAGTTFPLICGAAVPVTTRWHDGANPLPVVGDIIYENPFGTSVLPGNDLYWRVGVSPDVDYVSFGNDGVVFLENNCAACAEVAVPVVTVPDFQLEIGQSLELELTATNNPESWSLVSTCVTYFINGGVTGGIFEYTSCLDGSVREISIPINDEITICSSTVPVLVTGTGASVNVGTICQGEVLPEDIRLDEVQGVLSGVIINSGVYTITIEATNCFGTSAPVTFVINVVDSEAYRLFNMDSDDPQTNAFDACALGAAPFTNYYHSGLGVNPVVNDIVYDRSSSGEYFEFNGGYLWYLTDAGEAIRIDSTGRIVDVSICGVTKTTEAGDDKTTENDLDKTIE